MSQPLLWLLLAGPAALLAAAVLPASATTRARRAFAAAALSVATALAALVVALAAGPQTTGTIGVAGIGFAVGLDTLSATVFLLVGFVGAVVLRFSRNYLAGDPGHARFLSLMASALAAVLVLVLSGNLFQLGLAWVATSVALHRLLLFYPERPAAVLAARKKVVFSRIGDACLIGAGVLIHQLVGSLDHAEIAASAATLADGALPYTVHGIAALLVAAALLKSAAIPVHGWLLEVMETPTPVSALLHAGIINAGGYLLLRYADLVALSAPSLDALALAGGLTALVGSLVMLPQTSVKVALAWSTVAQMGFMMLQIGLGAFSAALLHLVAHSLYKAHAFLTSGSAVDVARAAALPGPGGGRHPARVGLVAAALLTLALVVAVPFGAGILQQPGVFALAAVLVLGLVHLVVDAVDERPSPAVVARVLGLALATAGAYFVLQAGAALLTAGVLPPVRPADGPFDLAVAALVVLGFSAVTVLQHVPPAAGGSPRWQAFHSHAANGFYLNTLTNRLAVRLWPAPAPMPAQPSPGV